MGYFPNLKKPVTFNEKMNWLKIYDQQDFHTQIADKYLARDYIASVIGEKYLIPLLHQTYDLESLKESDLPDGPFVIKANHDCGSMLFFKKKEDYGLEEIKSYFRPRLAKNYYYWSREYQYKNIKPCVIIERLVLKKDGQLPFDYKLYCFNGKAKVIAVDKDRGLKSKSRHWFDADWNKLDIDWNTKSDDSRIEKPPFFDEIVQCSEKFAKDFLFLRVDWYDVDGKVYIGELTLMPGGGIVEFRPKKWDKILGDMLELPRS